MLRCFARLRVCISRQNLPFVTCPTMSGAAEGGEAEGESHKVMVYQYDLSGGMAAAFSEAMLGECCSRGCERREAAWAGRAVRSAVFLLALLRHKGSRKTPGGASAISALRSPGPGLEAACAWCIDVVCIQPQQTNPFPSPASWTDN